MPSRPSLKPKQSKAAVEWRARAVSLMEATADAMTDVVPDARHYFGQQTGEVGSSIFAGILAAWAVGISDSLGLVRGFTPGASLMQT